MDKLKDGEGDIAIEFRATKPGMRPSNKKNLQQLVLSALNSARQDHDLYSYDSNAFRGNDGLGPEAEIKRLKDERGILKQWLSVYREVLKYAGIFIDDVQKEKDDYHNENQDLASQIQDRDRKYRSLDARLNDSNAQNEKLWQEAEEIKQEAEECRHAYHTLMREYKMCEVHMRRAEQDNERLREEGVTNETRKKTYIMDNKKLRRLINESNRKLNDLGAKLKSSHRHIEWLKRDRKACKESWSDLEVVKSKQKLEDENRNLTRDMLSMFKLMETMMIEKQAGIEAGRIQVHRNGNSMPPQPFMPEREMFDIPLPPKSEEIPMSDVSDGTGVPTLPIPDMHQDKRPNPESMDLTDDPEQMQTKWLEMITQKESRPNTLMAPEDDASPPRKRARRERGDDQLRHLEFDRPVREIDQCNHCGRADHVKLCQEFESGSMELKEEVSASHQSQPKRPQTQPTIRLTRPSPSTIKRHNDHQRRKIAPLPTRRVQFHYPQPTSEHPNSEDQEDHFNLFATLASPSVFDIPQDAGKLAQACCDVVETTRREYLSDRWLSVLTGIVLFLLCLWYYFVEPVMESRKWMQANKVPQNVIEELNERRVSEFQWVQALDYRIGQWLEIDRVAFG